MIIVNFTSKSIKYLDRKKLEVTGYIDSIMHWLEFDYMGFYNKHVSWKIYNPYTKCTKQDKNYDCGPITIRFIDLDKLGASLVFSHDMV